MYRTALSQYLLVVPKIQKCSVRKNVCEMGKIFNGCERVILFCHK